MTRGEQAWLTPPEYDSSEYDSEDDTQKDSNKSFLDEFNGYLSLMELSIK